MRLPKDLATKVARSAREQGISKSEAVRDAVKRLFLLQEFDELAAKLTARARAKGIVSEEQIFKMVS